MFRSGSWGLGVFACSHFLVFVQYLRQYHSPSLQTPILTGSNVRRCKTDEPPRPRPSRGRRRLRLGLGELAQLRLAAMDVAAAIPAAVRRRLDAADRLPRLGGRLAEVVQHVLLQQLAARRIWHAAMARRGVEVDEVGVLDRRLVVLRLPPPPAAAAAPAGRAAAAAARPPPPPWAQRHPSSLNLNRARDSSHTPAVRGGVKYGRHGDEAISGQCRDGARAAGRAHRSDMTAMGRRLL